MQRSASSSAMTPIAHCLAINRHNTGSSVPRPVLYQRLHLGVQPNQQCRELHSRPLPSSRLSVTDAAAAVAALCTAAAADACRDRHQVAAAAASHLLLVAVGTG
jgi:hypothetical protein